MRAVLQGGDPGISAESSSSVLPGAFKYSVGCVGDESGESSGAPVGYMAGADFDENPFFVRGGMERLGASRKKGPTPHRANRSLLRDAMGVAFVTSRYGRGERLRWP